MAWIFSLWAQARTSAEARGLAAHFEGKSWALGDGAVSACSVSIVSSTCCWIAPSNVSRTGVTDAKVAARLTEVGGRLYEHLRSAPSFLYAIVGVEVDEVRSEQEIEELMRHSPPAFHGMVVSTELWRRAGEPSGFVAFAPGYVWRPYGGEVAR